MQLFVPPALQLFIGSVPTWPLHCQRFNESDPVFSVTMAAARSPVFVLLVPTCLILLLVPPARSPRLSYHMFLCWHRPYRLLHISACSHYVRVLLARRIYFNLGLLSAGTIAVSSVLSILDTALTFLVSARSTSASFFALCLSLRAMLALVLFQRSACIRRAVCSSWCFMAVAPFAFCFFV